MKITPKYAENLPDCKIVRLYPLLDAALLWCGVSQDDLEEAKQEAATNGKGIFSHPYIPCLDNKTRVIYQAIEDKILSVCREDGARANDHVAYARRHLWANDLKQFIENNYPDDRPDFLFSEEEKRPVVDLDAYDRMLSENTNLKAEIIRIGTELSAAQSLARDSELAKLATDERLEKAKLVYLEQREEIERLKTENEKLKSENMTKGTAKTENKQAEIIAAISCIYTKTDCSKPFEAAETILQEWKRNAGRLGKPPTSDTLAKYIKQGINRLSQ